MRREWVIVAAHRQNRPWSGEVVERAEGELPPYLADCYLCPGNERVGGARNPPYRGTYVFDNDHPCVAPDAPEPATEMFGDVNRRRAARGRARVICYSPRHDLTLAELEASEVVELVKVWRAQYAELGKLPDVNHVLIFENKGEVVGVSNPHPHGQIYATNFVFKTIETEVQASREHYAATGRTLLRDVIAAEVADGRRILCENDAAIAFVPYFARYAYEVYVAPKAPHADLMTFGEEELRDFAEVLRKVTIRYDNLWRMSFPYVMVLHQAPTDGGDHRGFHFHLEFHPPLRRPNLLKYLAGPEIGGGNFLSDTAPEEKAAELRAQPDIHYKSAGGENVR